MRENEIKWNDDFNRQIHYSHCTSNSCGVLIAFFGSITYTIRKKASDKHGQILILEVLIDDTEFILINLYKANTENDQRTNFLELKILLENFDLTESKLIIFAGYFNLFLDQSLEAKGGNPCPKKQSLSKLLHIKEKLNLCDSWWIWNRNAKQYTFRQQRFSGFIQRRLDYIFIYQKAITTDHSPVWCSFQNLNQCQRGLGLWKFNNSLVCNEKYVLRIKELINKVKGELNHSNQFCDQVKWKCWNMKFVVSQLSFQRI